MKIQYREFTRPSACGEGEVFSRSWQPDSAPHAIIQIAHGMQEHAGRYDRFARRLAENGWAVYANDHIGHGKSAMGHMGTFSLMPGGFEFLLADMHTPGTNIPICRAPCWGTAWAALLPAFSRPGMTMRKS